MVELLACADEPRSKKIISTGRFAPGAELFELAKFLPSRWCAWVLFVTLMEVSFKFVVVVIWPLVDLSTVIFLSLVFGGSNELNVFVLIESFDEFC